MTKQQLVNQLNYDIESVNAELKFEKEMLSINAKHKKQKEEIENKQNISHLEKELEEFKKELNELGNGIN